MITGDVNDALEATIRVTVVGPNRQEVEVDAVLDTGFTDHLTLSSSTIRSLGLPFIGSEDACLADGSLVRLNLYLATAKWHDEERGIVVSEAEGGPLVGMSLLHGSQVVLDVIEGGSVLIRPLLAV